MLPSSFAAEQPLHVSPADARQRARLMLAARGFAVNTEGERVLAQGPQLQSPAQDPLGGAGRLVLAVRDAPGAAPVLRLEADLSGLKLLTALVVFFPPVLLLGVALALSLVEGGGLPGSVLVNALVWLVLGPLIALWLRRRTRRALERFLETVRSG